MATSTRLCGNGCPSEYKDPKYQKKCFQCKNLFHLPCFNINHPKSKIFVARNILFMCDSCFDSPVSHDPSPKRKAKRSDSHVQPAPSNRGPVRNISTVQTTLNFPSTSQKQTNKKPQEPGNADNSMKIIDMLVELSKKFDVNEECLNKIGSNVADIHAATSLNGSTRRQATKKPSYSNVVVNGLLNGEGAGPSNSTFVSSNAPKADVMKRKLQTGTSSIVQHSLGKAISATATKQFTGLKFSKSIYISRLETTVTIDDMTNYIKQQLPNVDSKHFNLRLLVKKSQNLADLSFISYRLLCSDDLFELMNRVDFWPSHVKIAEFVEKRSSNRNNIGDFSSDLRKMETGPSLENESLIDLVDDNPSIDTVPIVPASINSSKNLDLNNLSMEGLQELVN